MSRRFMALALAGALAWTVPAQADVLSLGFTNPVGAMSSVHTYTVNGVNITARGYTGVTLPTQTGTPIDLYGKTDGGDESGLGLFRPGTDFEIEPGDFIQLDLRDALQKMSITDAQIAIGSVQKGETYAIYGSNQQGVEGTQLISAGTLDDIYFSLPNLGTYGFYSISAPTGDVLLDGLTIKGTSDPVPEPASLALLSVGLGGLWVWRTRRSRASAG